MVNKRRCHHITNLFVANSCDKAKTNKMTEKQKMLTGQKYNSRDPELLGMYHKARKLIQSYNSLGSELIIEREKTLNELLGNVGKGVWIESPFFCDYGTNTSIGENTFVNTNCIFLDNNRIFIGRNGLIAPYVQILTSTHPLNVKERIIVSVAETRYTTFTKPVRIGDNVWIGSNSVIFPGVEIGDNVVIGAGSIVTKNVESNKLVYGNPCEVVKDL